MEYTIVIPSYKRPEKLRDATLKMLRDYQIPAERVRVVVASEEEKASYEAVLPPHLYRDIIVGRPGIGAVRNFITDFFPEDARIVSLDDDLDDMLASDGTKLVHLPSLEDLIQRGFERCEREGRNLWGIYPVANHFFMKNTVSTDMKFCIGHCFGYINKKIFTKINYKEDYERSILHSKRDGGVVRFNSVAARTKLGAPGGLGKTAAERRSVYEEEILYLLAEYPGCLRRNPKRDGEILLARKVPSV